MANKLYCELSEFIEAAQPKTSLTKYSIEFNDLAVQKRPHEEPHEHRKPFFEAVRQTLHITVCE